MTNFTSENIILILLGSVLYFLTEYKAKCNTAGFSMGYWLKDNWINLVINLVAIPAYFMLRDSIEKPEAFLAGFFPNYLVDKLLDMRDKFIPKQP
jgi:hypothetical protein